MHRSEMLRRVRSREKPWDIVVIGGGSTGIGCAVDAASRGFDVLLLEQHDFGKGTSSRSTKLVHGGVRYLEQGNISLVREALRERGILEYNAPHIVSRQAFTIPCYSIRQKVYYGIGLKFYDLLSGKYSFGKSKLLSRKETLAKLPNISDKNLVGGVEYFDGQFDDIRLLIDLAKTSVNHGATVLNYARVSGLEKNTEGKINGVQFKLVEDDELFKTKARVVVNATGAFCDEIRRLSEGESKDLIEQSQGIHLVFDKSFLKSGHAIMIPKTSDGRVLFAIPWHDKTLVGTTDTPIESATLEPKPLEEEINFILETCKEYLSKAPTRDDILSAFVGIRPLVKSAGINNTAALSREHTIEIDSSNLLTITGGKWTTYRKMAEDTINKSIEIADLPKNKCMTKTLKIDNETVERKINSSDKKLHRHFSYTKSDVINAVRNEMAQTIEDVLARRTRVLFLDAKAAIEIAPTVAEVMANLLDKDKNWSGQQVKDFIETAKNYLI